eukprot:TRINITY_DN270_c0_g1_i4.p2 TRINITY_DN270_c0_g1~~TRINITY_DN270_c0_g1_i4.p2  ORF type:complete len:654 (+),score=196.20 TRINITY_DN270_c0_g1_i4:79-2040(+)
MRAAAVALAALAAPCLSKKAYCQRGQSCWPTADAVAALSALLDPSATRNLTWPGPGSPRVCGVPIGSPGDQPLYGAGGELPAVYAQKDSDRAGVCYDGNFNPFYCLQATRNLPADKEGPAFIVWALTAEHVQHAVRFAADHNLCVSVVATGHDFLNRHSCPQGVMIRTALMKGFEWTTARVNRFNHAEGAVRLGPGHTFSEVHEAASARGKVVASGWAVTVGVVGWSIGGGHGPIGRWKGLGVDQVLEVELVGADGSLIVAGETGTRTRRLGSTAWAASNDTSLLWALRGGGGSTWGVVTAITVKTHDLPDTGFVYTLRSFVDAACGAEYGNFRNLIRTYFRWASAASSKWTDLVHVNAERVPDKDNNTAVVEIFKHILPNITTCAQYSALYGGCSSAKQVFESPNCQASPACMAGPTAIWRVCPETCGLAERCGGEAIYGYSMIWLSNYVGRHTDDEFVQAMKLMDTATPAGSYGAPSGLVQNWWQVAQYQALEPIYPNKAKWPLLSTGLFASVLLPKASFTDHSFTDRFAADALVGCSRAAVGPCGTHQEIYHAIPGEANPLPADAVSVPRGFRTAEAHMVTMCGNVAGCDLQKYYDIGANSYLSESSYRYLGAAWKARYWGENYGRLLAVKKQWDPTGVFWCRHCVGSDL